MCITESNGFLKGNKLEDVSSYSLIGGIKPFVGGVGLQVALKVVMNLKRITAGKMPWKKLVFNRGTLQLGIFMGSFSFLYKVGILTLDMDIQ